MKPSLFLLYLNSALRSSFSRSIHWHWIVLITIRSWQTKQYLITSNQNNLKTFVHNTLLLNLTLALVGTTVTLGFHPVRISSWFFTFRPRTSVGGRISYLRTALTRIQRLSVIAKRWPMQPLGPAENARTTTSKSTVVDRQWKNTYTHRVAIYMYLCQ